MVAPFEWSGEKRHRVMALHRRGLTPSAIRIMVSREWGLTVTPGMMAGFLSRTLKPRDRRRSKPKPSPKELPISLNGGGGLPPKQLLTVQDVPVVKPVSPAEASPNVQLPASPPPSRSVVTASSPVELVKPVNLLNEVLVADGKVRDAITGDVLGKVVRKCPDTVHPAFDTKDHVWFLDEDGTPDVQAPTLRVLQAMLPVGTVIRGYYPLKKSA